MVTFGRWSRPDKGRGTFINGRYMKKDGNRVCACLTRGYLPVRDFSKIQAQSQWITLLDKFLLTLQSCPPQVNASCHIDNDALANNMGCSSNNR